jgi:hypothetical protein
MIVSHKKLNNQEAKGYILAEGRGMEIQPKILVANKEICRFSVDVLQEADVANRNQRIYGWDLLMEGCQHPYVQERLRTNTFYCEIGHPKEQTVDRQLNIDRDNVSSIIKELKYNKPFIGGIVETAATSKGRDFMGLITINECKVAYSMRGLGKVIQEKGKFIVKKPLRIVCWDDVTHPSVEKAYMTEIINENANILIDYENANHIPSMFLLEDADFVKYIFECSPNAQEMVKNLEIDPYETGRKMIINEHGEIEIKGDFGKVICLTETYIQKEINSMLSRIEL